MKEKCEKCGHYHARKDLRPIEGYGTAMYCIDCLAIMARLYFKAATT